MENQTNNPAGTKPEAARDGLAEAIQKIEAARVRLYALADDALDDCQAGEEVESVARLLSYAQEAIEKAKGDAPDLATATTDALAAELTRRGCAVVVITPDDVREQWQTNQDADETDEPAPTETETRDALAFVQRRLNRTVHENEPAFEWGATSDACEWIAAARQAKKKGDAK